MNASLRPQMALGFFLAVPLFALPALGAATHKAGHKPTHYQIADFARAKALVSPATPVLRERETDGLSRDAEDCNRGCIDH
jgi:hypothetical protein